MVYGYRSYRRTGKRYARSQNSRFSRYNTYRYRSSKAQASQIYALNRKVQKIQRLTRPETLIRHGTLTDISTGGGYVFDLTPLIPRTEDSSTGVTTGDFEGNFARLNSLTYYGNAVLSSPSASSEPRQFRVVIVQTKATRPSDLEANDILRTETNDGAIIINGPLSDGAGRVAKILSDKKYTVSFQNPIVNIKTKLKYLRNYYLDPQNTEAVPKGKIYVFVYLGPSSSGNTIVTINHGYKLAYTDA